MCAEKSGRRRWRSIGSDLAILLFSTCRKTWTSGNSGNVLKTPQQFKMREALQSRNLGSVLAVAGENDKISGSGIRLSVIREHRSRPLRHSRGITRVERIRRTDCCDRPCDRAVFMKRKAISRRIYRRCRIRVETICYSGNHIHFWPITKKSTNQAIPHYIEVGHLEPAPLSRRQKRK